MIVVHCQSDEVGTPLQGHYYSCEACGLCSPVYYGRDGILAAARWGRDHREAKAEAAALVLTTPEIQRRYDGDTQLDDPMHPISDDVRASRYHQEQSYKASRRWTLASLAVYLVCLWVALILNIVSSALRRVLHLGQ